MTGSLTGGAPRPVARSVARTWRLLLVLTALGLLASCADSDVGTSVRISVVYKDAWRLASADLVVQQDERPIAISREMLLLLPDEMATGEVLRLQIWGIREGERIAHGNAVALPRKGRTVDATIVLERSTCGVFCTPGEVQCEGDGLSECGLDEEDCLAWLAPTACAAETPFCSAGRCGVGCVDDCADGETKCVDADKEVRCGQFDGDVCKDFSMARTCDAGQLCYAGRCAPRCTFEATHSLSTAETASAFHPSIAVDGKGKLHGVYSANLSRSLMYAARGTTSWPTWTAIGAVGQAPSLAADAQGLVHLVFYDPTAPAAVKYGRRALNGTWTFETVKALGDVGSSLSIAVEAGGTPHVVFYDPVGPVLYYARKSGATWLVEPVSPGTDQDLYGGERCDIALAGSTPHLSFYSLNNNIVHAVRSPEGVWSRDGVAFPSGTTIPATATTSIAVDRSSTPHIAYMNRDLLGFLELYVASYVGGAWGPQSVDLSGSSAENTGALASLAVDPFDGLHVAYMLVNSNALQYAVHPRGGSWNQLHPSTRPGLDPSLAIAPNGDLYILSADRSTTPRVIESRRLCQ